MTGHPHKTSHSLLGVWDNKWLQSPASPSQRARTAQKCLEHVRPLPMTQVNQLPLRVSPGFFPMNWSVIPYEGSYLGLIRSVNYRLTPAGYILQNDGVIRNENWTCRLNDDFQIQPHTQRLLQNTTPSPLPPNGPVVGIEDCRLFTHEDRLYFSGTTPHLNPRGDLKMATGLVENKGVEFEVSSLSPLSWEHEKSCEKNWLPLTAPGHPLRFIYQTTPMTILEPDPKTGHCVSLPLTPSPALKDPPMRGGAAPIPFNKDDGFLYMVHELLLETPARHYTHRFIHLGSDYQLLRISRPFILRQHGVEFVMGLAWNKAQTQLYLSFGANDGESWQATVSWETVEAQLEAGPNKALL